MFKKITKFVLVVVVMLGAYLQYGSVLAYMSITADAGPDQYLNHDLYNNNLVATLHGSGTDPNGSSLIYYWTCTGGSLSDPTIINPIFTFPSNTSQATYYTCTLTVTDTLGISATDTVSIYLNSNPNTSSPRAQTNPATDITGNGATLHGYFSANDTYTNNYTVWFQWGTGATYAAETPHQAIVYSSAFSQSVVSLTPNTLYHCRAVAQQGNNGQVFYGQDVNFTTSANGQVYNNSNPSLLVIKTARNLSVGNLTWSNSVSARPNDIIQFNIAILTSSSQYVNNLAVRDVLPANLIYNNGLTLDGVANTGNIVSGLNIATVSAGQTRNITYQAQVAPAQNFSSSTATLTNSVFVTSGDFGYSPSTSFASVMVTREGVLGATTVSTGLTNNFLVDSFFLPLLIALIGVWLYKYRFIRIPQWASLIQLDNKEQRAKEELKKKITKIKQQEDKDIQR